MGINQASIFNQTQHFFQIIYHSIKNVIEASQRDVYTINGKNKIYSSLLVEP
jgi:hypothetical protein